MKRNTSKIELDIVEEFDKYPIFRGSIKHQLGSHFVGEIEEPEWYGQVVAFLTGDDMTDDFRKESV